MSIYCLCEAKNDKPDSQAFGAPNRYCGLPNDYGQEPENPRFPPLALRVPMKCIAMGVTQVIEERLGPNDWSDAARPTNWRKHYPNVDIFECPNCHARIAR